MAVRSFMRSFALPGPFQFFIVRVWLAMDGFMFSSFLGQGEVRNRAEGQKWSLAWMLGDGER